LVIQGQVDDLRRALVIFGSDHQALVGARQRLPVPLVRAVGSRSAASACVRTVDRGQQMAGLGGIAAEPRGVLPSTASARRAPAGGWVDWAAQAPIAAKERAPAMTAQPAIIKITLI
jgi:hypothetical protein